ncbi:MAG: TolC family protein, partial [Sedimentisphaerales bacterium]|nr:TolC family protein [Sedimentisphaerales bacterium]
ERELAAQTAKVGVAVADLYPRFTLNGSIGMEAVSLSKLANNVSTPSDWVLQGGPQVTWNIFDAGAIRQTINVQSAIQEQKLIQYEASVLAALEEVENVLVAYANEYQKNNSLRQAAQAAQQAVELARFEYEAGLTDFSNVLEAQRSLLSFQDQKVESDGTMVSNLIRLYKALGGGWSSLMEQAQFDSKSMHGE